MSAFAASELDIRTAADDLPFIAAAGMRFSHSHMIAERKGFYHSCCRSTVLNTDSLHRNMLIFIIPQQDCKWKYL